MSYEVQNFQEDVIEASRKQAVLVDFWAPWCGPCRTLGPILEKLAAEENGNWKLAKVDTDQNAEISMQYGIRGIPAVKLFIDGEVVNEFTGALPEHEVRKWLHEALPSETKSRLAEAEQLIAEGNQEQASALLEAVLASEPTHAIASGLLAQILAFQDPDRAAELAENAASDLRFTQIAASIVQLAQSKNRHNSSGDIADEAGKTEYVEASRALDAGELDKALESIIEVLKVNRYLDDDGARKMGIALFTLLGQDHALTRKYRRTFDMWLN